MKKSGNIPLKTFFSCHNFLILNYTRQLINKKQGNEGSLITGGKDYLKQFHYNLSNLVLLDPDDLAPVTRDSPEMTTLPDPDLSKLQEILDILKSAHTLHEKDKLSTFITVEVRLCYVS